MFARSMKPHDRNPATTSAITVFASTGLPGDSLTSAINDQCGVPVGTLFGE